MKKIENSGLAKISAGRSCRDLLLQLEWQYLSGGVLMIQAMKTYELMAAGYQLCDWY